MPAHTPKERKKNRGAKRGSSAANSKKNSNGSKSKTDKNGSKDKKGSFGGKQAKPFGKKGDDKAPKRKRKGR